MKNALRLFALAALMVFVSCSSRQNANQAATPAPPLRNPLSFNLYPGAKVVSTHAFTQNVVIQNGQNPGSVFNSGSGTYAGREVIAASGASFDSLSSWLRQLSASPPKGYASVESVPDADAQSQEYGLSYAAFQQDAGNHHRGMLIIVMDPQRVNERFGRILGMIAKYRALPAIMRAPIDNEAKARIGISITEATQPDSPVGAALAALDQFEHQNARGIVVIDAAKR